MSHFINAILTYHVTLGIANIRKYGFWNGSSVLNNSWKFFFFYKSFMTRKKFITNGSLLLCKHIFLRYKLSYHYRWRLLSIEGSLTCHTSFDTGHSFIMVNSEDPRQSHLPVSTTEIHRGWGSNTKPSPRLVNALTEKHFVKCRSI